MCVHDEQQSELDHDMKAHECDVSVHCLSEFGKAAPLVIADGLSSHGSHEHIVNAHDMGEHGMDVNAHGHPNEHGVSSVERTC